jgi:DNA-binding beta-propeller fold protein YncE
LKYPSCRTIERRSLPPGANTVTPVDLTNTAQVSNIQIRAARAGKPATPDGSFLYVANDVSNNVGVIDATARRP